MVENGLHWVMDVTFRDDQCRIRKPFDFRLWPREWLGRDAEFFGVDHREHDS
jgi:hypothetical protein